MFESRLSTQIGPATPPEPRTLPCSLRRFSGGFDKSKGCLRSRFYYIHELIYMYKHKKHTFLHTCTHTYIHTHKYIHAYMHARVHAYVRTYLHTYTHTIIRTYRHTYMHTHIASDLRHRSSLLVPESELRSWTHE